MPELEKFYEQYVDKVYKFFYIQCLDVSLAEDLTSQTFIACIEKFNNEIGDHKKYLYGIMRNIWANHLRNKYQESVQNIENIEDFATYSEQIINEYEGVTLAQRARHYIERLPEKQRVIARMRFLEERSIQEISTELKMSKIYVKTTQYRAVKNLRKMFRLTELRSMQ